MHILLTLAAVFFVSICGLIGYLFYLTPSPGDNLK
jgi:hypothetical protein